MFRRTLAVSLLAFSLVGCGSEPPPSPTDIAIEHIREDAPAFANSSDEELTTLMRQACSVLDQNDGNPVAFITLAMQYDLDPHDVGVVTGNAVKAMCPEYADIDY